MDVTVTVLDSQIFKAYFYTDADSPVSSMDMLPDKVYGCCVIADTIDQALQKIHAAFPGRVTTSLFAETLTGATGPLGKVVL